MEAIGIVYILDDLGRIRIPRYVRRRLNIQESDPLQIFIGDNNEIILKKCQAEDEHLTENKQ